MIRHVVRFCASAYIVEQKTGGGGRRRDAGPERAALSIVVFTLL
jgi:hypothetical protein